MGFIHSCYIKVNNKNLRDYLDSLGYVYGGQERTYGEYNGLYCLNGRYYECVQKPSCYHNIIDCGTNEELFLALVGVRNDSDYGSWFKIPKTKVVTLPGCYGTTIGMDGHVTKLIGYEIYKHEEENNKISEYIERNKDFEEYLPIKMTTNEIIDFFNIEKQ